ncbi:MAG: S4 domain-containing protein [Gemmatimonadaceae bacterium]
MRVDLALKRLLLVKSRSEAKEACDVGAVFVNGRPVKASAEVNAGDLVRIDFAQRTLEVEVLGDIGRNVSRQQARELVRVVRDEPAE